MPFADLFNHLSGAEHVHFTGHGADAPNMAGEEEEEEKEEEEEEEEDGQGEDCVSRGREGATRKELFMEVVRPAKKGDELFNTYGKLSSAGYDQYDGAVFCHLSPSPRFSKTEPPARHHPAHTSAKVPKPQTQTQTQTLKFCAAQLYCFDTDSATQATPTTLFFSLSGF